MDALLIGRNLVDPENGVKIIRHGFGLMRGARRREQQSRCGLLGTLVQSATAFIRQTPTRVSSL
jgi:hypothetical protein